MKVINPNSGQSLIEITLALGITAIVVSALIISVVNGLKNSQFAQNQIHATKLSQDGIESVKVIKRNNYGVCLTNDSTNPHSWDIADSNSVWFYITTVKRFTYAFSPTSGPTECALTEAPLTTYEILGIFKRKITIEATPLINNPSDFKVISEVTWIDSSGTHNSQLVTILSKY